MAVPKTGNVFSDSTAMVLLLVTGLYSAWCHHTTLWGYFGHCASLWRSISLASVYWSHFIGNIEHTTDPLCYFTNHETLWAIHRMSEICTGGNPWQVAVLAGKGKPLQILAFAGLALGGFSLFFFWTTWFTYRIYQQGSKGTALFGLACNVCGLVLPLVFFGGNHDDPDCDGDGWWTAHWPIHVFHHVLFATAVVMTLKPQAGLLKEN